MDVKKSSFDTLPFSKLFQHYISGNGTITDFFETHPANKGSVHESVDSFEFKGERSVGASILEKYNHEHLDHEVTRDQIGKVKKHDCLTVVTGQQVTLFGGPLYTVYKTITAILYAKKLEKETGRPVIPIFWLADEDHDIEEVSTINIPGSYDQTEITYSHIDYENAPPASTIQLGDELSTVQKLLKENLDETDFTADLLDQITSYYKSDRTFGGAFGDLLMSYFGKHGLLLAGSLNQTAKSHTTHLLKKAVKLHVNLTSSLDDTTYALKEAGYHDQVQVQPSNLFYLTESGERIKIQCVDDTWSIPSKKWSSSELLDEIDNHPEQFSPNVFLRPILQDCLLPVAAYVGGPGEIAYYAQMKEFYENFGYKMPIIVPRFSLTIFESAIDRILEKLPFEWQKYLDRIEDLEKEFVETTDSVDIEKMFGIWRSQIDELSRAKRDKIGDIDPSLKGSVGKAKATYFSELDKLKGKVYRSVKEQEKVQIDRIKRIKNNLFPNDNLQEREIAFIFFMNKYGNDLWDRVIDKLSDEDPYNHLTLHL
ncbi:bacillithiol biosynthesis cysteine-adding enzyme BshC [Rhodohalobacter sp. 8-1]|uniref:bacillithiol biosynthesis cysteine-adding enzyme BshC n=1 Tax=Rhodohalobacter sp. 8-1 TaxID=3131972 RepID=UPI0030ECF9CE